mgnify:CR=1 FL=1
MVKAVRGAIQCSKDTEQEIASKIYSLISTMLEENAIAEKKIISIQFSQTEDLFELNCAAGLRKYGFANVPLFCSQEPKCRNSMPRVIRVLITCEMDENRECRHVYMNGAERLRPDIAG